MMKTNLAFIILSMLLLSPAVAQESEPSIEELLKPAPNPAWNVIIRTGQKTTKIDEGLYVYRYKGTRSIFIVTDEGVIATDPVSLEHAEHYRAAIAEVTDQPVKYVVYSHEHWDHIVGGQIFKDEGATFISHENCVKHFIEFPHPDVVMPDITFPDDYVLEFGGRSLELLYFGPNHGKCMVVMRPDPGDYIFTVDLVTAGSVPFGVMPDYSPPHWIRTLKEIEALDYKVMINGHGALVSHPSAITERRIYLETLMSKVKAAKDEGLTRVC